MNTPKVLQTRATAEDLLHREKKIFTAFGVTVTELFTSLRDHCIEITCMIVEKDICPQAVDPAASADLQKDFTRKVLDETFKHGRINYIFEKIKKLAMDTVFKIPSFVTLAADEPHRIAANKNDEDELDAEIDALSNRLIMLRSQTQCVDNEQANIDALIEIAKKCVEVDENASPSEGSGISVAMMET